MLSMKSISSIEGHQLVERQVRSVNALQSLATSILMQMKLDKIYSHVQRSSSDALSSRVELKDEQATFKATELEDAASAWNPGPGWLGSAKSTAACVV